MESRRLAFFLQDLSGGGAEGVMLTLAAGFADRGCDVDLVLVRQQGPRLVDVPPNVRIVAMGTRRTAFSIPQLACYLRRELPLALISALVHVNIAAIVAARICRLPLRVVITEHNQLSQPVGHVLSATAYGTRRSVSWLYPLADEVVAVSSGVRASLLAHARLDERRVHVIHNPVDTPALQARALQEVTHPWFEFGQPPVVLGVGRLIAQKDFTNLLRAFAIIRQSRPARLMILGDGHERSSLTQLAQRLGVDAHVDMPGFVTNPYAYMSRAAVFVLSSAWEGLPTVLIEAMACGTPVVATNCRSGPAEILDDGRWGELVPVADPGALAAAILRTLDRPAPAGSLRDRASEFSIDRAVDRYAHVLGAQFVTAALTDAGAAVRSGAPAPVCPP